jgi:chaperonin GroES
LAFQHEFDFLKIELALRSISILCRKLTAAEEKTSGGIIIPDTAKEKPQRGKVIAVGTGKKDEPMTVKVGDTVLYGKYAGTEIQVEGKDYLIMRESDIFAII